MVSFHFFFTCVVNFSFRRCIYRCSKLWTRPKIWIQISIFLPSETEGGTKLNFPQCWKITKMSHSNFHAENDDNFWCESQVQKMLASLAMMQNETFWVILTYCDYALLPWPSLDILRPTFRFLLSSLCICYPDFRFQGTNLDWNEE